MSIKEIINDALITYDHTHGLIYLVKTGDFISCSPHHAKTLESITEKYKNKTLSAIESRKLEAYYQSIIKRPLRDCKEPTGLNARNILEKVEFIISTTCNLNCLYCYADAGTYGYKKLVMTPEQIKLYIDAIIEAGYTTINTLMFFGGEPCLGKKTIIQCCKYIYKLYNLKKLKILPRITLVTNGTLLDTEMINAIKHYNILTTISLDGPKEIHNRLRPFYNGGGTYDHIINSIQEMNNMGCKPNLIEATYTKVHQDEGFTKETLKEFLINVSGSDKILIENCTGEKNKNICPDTSDSETKKSLVYDIHFIAGLGSKAFSGISCGAGLSSFAVLPDGALYPYHFFISHLEYQCGSIHDGKIVFSNYKSVKEKLLALSKLKNNDCISCWRKSICINCPATRLLGEDNRKNSCTYKHIYNENDMLNFLRIKLDTNRWQKIQTQLKQLHRESCVL